MSIAVVIARMQGVLDEMPERPKRRRVFLETYLRTTRAIDQAVQRGDFEDPDWVEEWDVVFADLYLDALEAHRRDRSAPRPWRLALEAPEEASVLVHLLLGINAHINYDLPQSLLSVIPAADFDNEVLMASRHRDHAAIDGVLSARVAAEDAALGGPRSLLDRALTPLNRAGSKRFLAESRRKVWHNTVALHEARLLGPDVYQRRLDELEVLCAAKIADLLEPGQVILRLAVKGFGVTLPPA